MDAEHERLVTIDLNKVPCGIHNGQMLAECGCPLECFDMEWAFKGVAEAAGRFAGKLAREREERILAAIGGATAGVGSLPPCRSASGPTRKDR